MEIFCRAFLLAAATSVSAIALAENPVFDASASAIRDVVAGKICVGKVGKDVVTFGESVPGAAGTFQRVGHPSGTYNIGYGTILISRDDDVHGHVTSVFVADRMLYMSTGAYRCGMSSSAVR